MPAEDYLGQIHRSGRSMLIAHPCPLRHSALGPAGLDELEPALVAAIDQPFAHPAIHTKNEIQRIRPGARDLDDLGDSGRNRGRAGARRALYLQKRASNPLPWNDSMNRRRKATGTRTCPGRGLTCPHYTGTIGPQYAGYGSRFVITHPAAPSQNRSRSRTARLCSPYRGSVAFGFPRKANATSLAIWSAKGPISWRTLASSNAAR